MSEINRLVQTLKEASERYYNYGDSLLTDAQYDEKVEQLRQLDPDNAFLKTVGTPPIGTKIKHKIPMGSQEKLKDRAEFDRWVTQIEDLHKKLNSKDAVFIVEWKLDGSSVSLEYENGKLIHAVSRGDAIIGEEILENVLKMQNVKPQIPGFTGALRGEMMLKIKTFEEIFKPKGYKNPRNTVAGLSRDQKGGDLQKHFDVIYYDIISEKEFSTEIDRLKFIENFDLKTVDSGLFSSPTEVWTEYGKLEKTRSAYEYEVDGVIIRANSIKIQKELGESSDLRPKGQRCIKFTAQGATTKLIDCVLSLGHTGSVVPTGKVEPVQIGGVTVSSVLLNNFEEIERLGVAIGDEVELIRAGDVIPKVVRVIKKAADRQLIPTPTKCPSCKSTLVKDGAHIFCRNEDCKGQAFQRLKNWVTKRNIKYLGDELLAELYENHNIKECYDLYKLTEEYLSGVRRGNGVVGTAAKQIMAEIEKSKDCPLNEFLGSLSIKLLGRRQVEILIDGGVDSLEKFLVAKAEDFDKVPGFPATGSKATAIAEGIKKARPMIAALFEAGVRVAETKKEKITEDGKLGGKVVCFTGIRPSPEEQAIFISLGGVVKDGVSKNLTHLVVKDPSSTSNKAEKARSLGIQIVGYGDFQAWLK